MPEHPTDSRPPASSSSGARTRPIQIGIIGAGSCDDAVARDAEFVGRAVARRGWVLVCGGLEGVMGAACRGAFQAGGTTIGVLPGTGLEPANQYLTARIATGFGHGRNVLIPRSSDGVIAISGGYGTLSEIGLTLKMGIPLVGLRTWKIDPSYPIVENPEEAVRFLEEELT